MSGEVAMADKSHAGLNNLHCLLSDLSQSFLNAVQHSSARFAGASTTAPLNSDQVSESSGADQPASILRRLLTAQRQATACTDAAEGLDGPRETTGPTVAERQQILDGFMSKLQAAATGMADSIERNTPAEIPDYCREPPTAATMERMLALAHRLSYTSFAPPGFEPGVTPLGNFRPPAPQDWQLRAAQLHQFAMEHEQAQLRKEGQLPTSIAAEQPAASTVEIPPALLASIPRMPPGWKPGDKLPDELPPMPPGWKAGDPLPGMPPEAPAAAEAAPKIETVAAAPQAPPPEAPRLQRPQLDASFLVLNPDLEEAVEEDYSSSEEDDFEDI